MARYYLYIILTVLFCSVAYSQVATPSAYTTYLRLKQYASGANAGSDSLNHNSTVIDNFAKASNDTMVAVKADVYSVISYSGGIIDGTVMWDDLSTSAKATVVQVAGTQSIAGNKTFTDNMYADAIYPNDHAVYNLGKREEAWKYVYATRFIVTTSDGSDSTDISYDGSALNFGVAKLSADTLEGQLSDANATSLNLYQIGIIIPNVGDTVIAADRRINRIELTTPGNVTLVETLTMVDAYEGLQVTIYHSSASDTVTLKDEYSSGNLRLSGDFAMAQYDMITLQYEGSNLWLEVSRSNN